MKSSIRRFLWAIRIGSREEWIYSSYIGRRPYFYISIVVTTTILIRYSIKKDTWRLPRTL
jgi:hypothetical protein